MKRLQQLWMAGVFILMLTTAAFAGDIATGGLTQPPPADESSPITPGEIATAGNPLTTSDSVADIALDLLQTMLSVF